MLESFPVSLLVGTALGFLSGLGVGGGSLLLLWLTLALEMPYPEARAINLMFFLPSAGISLLLRRKKGRAIHTPILPAILSGCICAALFSQLGKHLDIELLRKAFGILLLITALRELTYQPKEASSS